MHACNTVWVWAQLEIHSYRLITLLGQRIVSLRVFLVFCIPPTSEKSIEAAEGMAKPRRVIGTNPFRAMLKSLTVSLRPTSACTRVVVETAASWDVCFCRLMGGLDETVYLSSLCFLSGEDGQLLDRRGLMLSLLEEMCGFLVGVNSRSESFKMSGQLSADCALLIARSTMLAKSPAWKPSIFRANVLRIREQHQAVATHSSPATIHSCAAMLL